MIVIGLSDVHGDAAIIEKMGMVVKQADVVVLAGDITHFGHAAQARRVVDAVRGSASCVLAVPGNCDHADVNAWLDNEGINLHPEARMVGNLGFAGLGGSLYTPFNTPFEYSEAQAENFLSQASQDLPENLPFVLVSHQPPADTSCDRLRDGRHVGCNALRKFINETQPLVCFTGHIHESPGTDTIGDTVIVNPGRPGTGRYAYAEISGRSVSVEVRSLSELQSRNAV